MHDALFFVFHDALCLFLFSHIDDAFFIHVLAHGVCANHKNKNGDNRSGPITTHADISNNVNIL